jgi:hypothetical protein
MSEKYRRFGLRSDRNLSDLSNKRAALENVLNDLSENFTASDILVIEGLRNTNININDFRQLRGNVDRVTLSENGNLVQTTIEPLITLKDKIDNLKVVTRDPPYLQGGTGPNAYFIPSTNLTDQNSITIDSKGDEIVAIGDVGSIGPIEFWDNGEFVLDSKIVPQFPDTYGAIQWEGYISSQISGIQVETTGFFLIEEDKFDDNNWITLKSFYDDSHIIAITQSSGNTYNVETDIEYVMVGSSVVYNGSSYTVTAVNNADSQIIIENLTAPLSSEIVTVNSPIETIDYQSGIIPITQFASGDLNRIRITMWWPELAGKILENKSFNFENQNSQQLEYVDLFKTNNATELPGSKSYEYFKRFRASETRQSTAGTFRVNSTLRGEYSIPQDRDEKISTLKIRMRYDGTGRMKRVSGSSFSSLEIGDWMVFQKPDNTFFAEQILEVDDGNTLFYQYLRDDESRIDIVPIDTEIDVVIVKNLGLKGIYLLDNDDPSLNYTKISGDDLRVNDLLVAMDYNESSVSNIVFDIRSVDADVSAITIEPLRTGETGSLASSPLIIGAIYSDAALKDLSSVEQCQGTFGAEVLSTAAAGQKQIEVSDTGFVTLDPKIYVQYKSVASDPTIYQSDVINDGVYITAVNTNTITLSENLNEEVPKSATLVFVQEEHWAPGANKEFCVLPLNTAPPFEGTDTGLRTTDSFPNLDVKTLQFTSLEAPNLTVTEIPESSTRTYSETLSIVDSSGKTYQLLFQ